MRDEDTNAILSEQGAEIVLSLDRNDTSYDVLLVHDGTDGSSIKELFCTHMLCEVVSVRRCISWFKAGNMARCIIFVTSPTFTLDAVKTFRRDTLNANVPAVEGLNCVASPYREAHTLLNWIMANLLIGATAQGTSALESLIKDAVLEKVVADASKRQPFLSQRNQHARTIFCCST